MVSFRIIVAATVIAAGAACSGERGKAARGNGPVETSPRITSSLGSSSTSEHPEIAVRLRPAPDDCHGPAPQPTTVTPAYGKLIGQKPMWGGFYAAYREQRQAFSAPDAPPKTYGFRVKVLWIMWPKQQVPVRITGTNLANGAPLYFDIEDVAKHDRAATLNPGAGGIGEQGWREFPSYLYFDRAGCFELKADWEGGSWRLVFGLGR
jgi:hypothetical protein